MKRALFFCLILSLSEAAKNTEKVNPYTCLAKDRENGLTELTNMETELSFCIEHAGRTCCSREDTN